MMGKQRGEKEQLSIEDVDAGILDHCDFGLTLLRLYSGARLQDHPLPSG